MEAVKFTQECTGLREYTWIGECWIEPKYVKFPSSILQVIPTRRKMIVKLEDGQIRYLKKTKKGFRLFSYNK